MKSLCFSLSSTFFLYCLLFIMTVFPVSHSNPELYKKCRNTDFKCGNTYARYPFYGGDREAECGHPGLELHCDDDYNTTIIEIVGVKYQVMDINHDTHILRIAREDFIKDGFCRPQTPIRNSTIDPDLFYLPPGYTNVTLFYDCPSSISSTLLTFSCNNYSEYKNVSVTKHNIRTDGCVANLTFQANKTFLERFLNNHSRKLVLEEKLKGVEVRWKEKWEEACRNCNATGGACGFDWLSNQTICICPHPSLNLPLEHPKECRRPGGSHDKPRYILLGLAIAAIVLVLATCFVVLRFKGQLLSDRLSQGKMKDNARIEAFITKFDSLTPRRYSYGEIKKITNQFNEKLGQGGYGSVYKGKLSDGRLVAVKVLSESKGNGEDFMNEVASISRTSHVNIVTLLGFCLERSKRALIYEFMPYGSLDRFIYDRGLHHQRRRLEWKTLYDIALGIARGLEYLHQGCNTRILHFDIKPHNILLNEDFCPKISDFGLSKVYESKESIISMTCARGTIGYIAPELCCRNFGGVSYKSDVYSYGMMILEMVGGRRNIDVGVSKTSEVYFPSWIYEHLDEPMKLNLNGEIVEEEEKEITRKLIIVSLWCIQSYPSDRPSMTQALEMFQGDLQSLVIPPKPAVSSPVRSTKTYIETSMV